MPNNFVEKANFLWQVANDDICVFGTPKAHEYGASILHKPDGPLTF